jgi:hypothetical protein
MSQTTSGDLGLQRADPMFLVFCFIGKKGFAFLSAFLRCHSEKGGSLLMHMFAVAFRTFDVAFFVFRNCKDDFKRLLASFAVELITRHWDLRKNDRAAGLLTHGLRWRIAGVKATVRHVIYLERGQSEKILLRSVPPSPVFLLHIGVPLPQALGTDALLI